MNRLFQVQGHQANRQNSTPTIPDILNLLRISQSESNLAAKFSESFEIIEFKLGDLLAKYNQTNSETKSIDGEGLKEGLYVICQGRVRLLGWNATAERDVSVTVLKAGDSFGTEALFIDISLLTKAIAASDGQLARMPIAQLQEWLEKLPQLQEYLLSTALTRQRLVFFKTSTELQRWPADRLQQLLPYLEETTIPAQEVLTEFCQSGRFWLRDGQIRKGEQVNTTVIGESWGDPNPTPADWIAQTDLLVYKLPTEHWEVAGDAGIMPTSRSALSVRVATGSAIPLLSSKVLQIAVLLAWQRSGSTGVNG